MEENKNTATVQQSIKTTNWFEQVNHSLVFTFPELHTFSSELVVSLSSLFLKGLPYHLRQAILRILPKESLTYSLAFLELQKDPSLHEEPHYTNFVEIAANALTQADPSPHSNNSEINKSSKKLADLFLWNITKDFPSEIKKMISENLPPDLTSRMNLYSTYSEDSKVA
jgi:hypothetical protein